MKPKQSIQFSIGWSSILMIFVVLCLAAFGILSCVTANADYKISAKTAQNTQSYYDLLRRSEQKLQAVDAAVLQARSDARQASDTGNCGGLGNSGDYEKISAVEAALKSSEPAEEKFKICCVAFSRALLAKQGVTFSDSSAETVPMHAGYSVSGSQSRNMHVSLVIDPFSDKGRCEVTGRELSSLQPKEQEGESALNLWQGN